MVLLDGLANEPSAGLKCEPSDQEQVLDLSVPAKKPCVQGKTHEALEAKTASLELSKSPGSESPTEQSCRCKCSGKCHLQEAERSHTQEGPGVLRPVPHNPLEAAAALGAMSRLPFPIMYYPWPLPGLNLSTAGLNLSPTGLPSGSLLSGGLPSAGGLSSLPSLAGLTGGLMPGVSPGLSGLTGFTPGFGLAGLPGFPAVPIPVYPGALTKTPQTVAASSAPPVTKPSITRPTPTPAVSRARSTSPPAREVKVTPVLRHKRAPRHASEQEQDCENDDIDSHRKRTIEQRREANARERQRVQLLLQAFDDLRLCLPTLSPACDGGALAARPSKMWILRAATAYISALSALLERDPARPETVLAFDEASDWLVALLRQSGRVTANNLSDRPSRQAAGELDKS